MSGPIAQLQLEDATAVGTDMLAQAIATALGNSLLVVAQGKLPDGTKDVIALNADRTMSANPIARAKHWVTTTNLNAGVSGTASTPENGDNYSAIAGFVVVTFANATDFANGNFVLEVQTCAADTFLSGEVFISPFAAKAPASFAKSYPANVKVLGFVVPLAGEYVRVQLHNTGTSNFSKTRGEAYRVSLAH